MRVEGAVFRVVLLYLLLPVVSELDGGAVEDAAEGDGLDLPVGDGVAEQADAGVHGLLVVEGGWTEVFRADGGDLVGMEIHHLMGDGTPGGVLGWTL